MVVMLALGVTECPAQDDPQAPVVQERQFPPVNADGTLSFTFERAPWRDVVTWLADASGWALHVGELPTGSFTYSDSSPFTPDEAVARVNLFLQPQGFTLIRSGALLSAIDMSDPRGRQRGRLR